MAKGGFPGMGNMQQMMKQAQRMQQDVARIQEEMSNREFEVSVGGGAVRTVITGSKVFKSVTIDPQCIDPDDADMLQDLILSAVNEALRTADSEMEAAMQAVTGGLKLGF